VIGTSWLAAQRITLGFATAAIAFWFAAPTPRSLAAGAALASVGEALRVWAAGHLEKSKEVTRSGPYRYTRHPLYLGSALIGIGIAVIARDLAAAATIAIYLAATLTAAVRSEEAHLREKFGDAYDAYAERRAAPMDRAFSWARARANREHHAVAGLAAGLGLLGLKALLGG
jgi:protein-S-isoprenylcysteine O-methyltransferase Ste14